MNMLIVGDFYIADIYRNEALIDKSVEDLFQQADYRVVNLEAPFTLNESKNRIHKTGPHLRMSAETVIPYLKQLKVDVVTMANNHILDYGTKGLLDTLFSLEQNNIAYVGAGRNLREASQFLTFEKDGLRVAILNFCENEWSIAEPGSPGANPMDIIDNAAQIRKAKETHSKVVCVVHGGHEYYNLPSPRMQKQYRFYVEQGADVVIGHHTHCIGGSEVYKGVPICYSLGNFLFTKNNKNDEWYIGLVLEVEIQERKTTLCLHPIKQEKESFSLSLLVGKEKERVLSNIETMNQIILNEQKLGECWKDYIERQSDVYLNAWSPLSFVKNRYIRVALEKMGVNLLNKKGLGLYLNLIRCEAHRDVSKRVIGRFLKLKQ